jgi:DNA-binding XRE family transcriptional regulator
MSVQIIEKNGKPEYAVIPYQEYERLLELAEDMADARAFDEAMARDEEIVPYELVKQLLEGGNPIRLWRQHRGLTQAQLAKKVKVGQPYIAMLEKGERKGAVEMLQRIAAVLEVEVDDLLP